MSPSDRPSPSPPASTVPPPIPGAGGSTLKGLGYYLLSALAFTAMNAIVRHLSTEMHPFEMAFYRSLFGVLALAPAFVRSGLAPLKTNRLATHGLRGLFGIGSLITFFLALAMLPLAKVSALFFSTPMFVTILATIFLGEAIRVRRVLALIVGAIGMLVIMRPGADTLDMGALMVLASAILSAASLIVTKALMRTESGVTVTLYNGLFILPFAFLFALPVWQTPSGTQLAWMAAVGVVGTLGQLAVNQAFKEADAGAVMPVEFTKLIWAAAIGYLAFAEVPENETWLGGCLIFASVSYIAWRERTLRGGPGSADPGSAAPGAEKRTP